jgi:hypothetical protein
MGKGIVKLGEGQWAVKDGNLLAAKETNGRFKNAEFTVTRGSDATYVGRDGLIKNTSSNIESEVFLNPNFDETIPLGNAGSGWSDSGLGEVAFYNGGLKITGEGVGTAKARARDASLSSAILETSRLYELTYTIKSISSKSNTLSLYMAGNTHTITQKSVGTHTVLVASGTDANKIFQFQWSQSDNESIVFDNVSLKESIVANGTFDTDLSGWSPGTGWSWNNGKASNNGSSGSNNLTQSSILDIGKTYKITITVSDWVSGNVEVSAGALPRGTMSANGTYTFYQTCTPNNNFYIIANAFNGSIDNVSVFEIDNGALPRIDFTDNTDGHLLLEPQSTNLIPYSEGFSQWSNVYAALTPNQSSPDGSNNAFIIEDESDTAYRKIDKTITTNATPHTFSVFIKKKTSAVNSYSGIQMGTGFSYVVFDSFNGTYHEQSNTNYDNVEVQDFNSNWWRLKLTATVTTSTRVALWGAISSTATNINNGATGSETFYGAQLEELSYATSYIPTNGSTVTRDADTCTGAGEAADFNSEEGVLYAEIVPNIPYTSSRQISLNDGTYENRVIIEVRESGTKIRFYVFQSNSNVFEEDLVISDLSTNYKCAISYKENDVKAYVNGVEVATSTSVAMPTGLNDISFAGRSSGSLHFYGKCKAIRVYKETDGIDLGTLTSL